MAGQTDHPKGGPALARGIRVKLIGLVSSSAFCAAMLLADAAAAQVADPAAGVVAQPVATAQVPQTSDTLFLRQVGAMPWWFERAASIAAGLLSILALVLVAVLIRVVWSIRKSQQTIHNAVEKLQGEAAPLLRHGGAIADDVHYITTSLRADVQLVNQTVAGVNRRLLAAVEKAEDRAADLHALLEVAQEEAESAFISTAAALRGIGTGAASLAGGGGDGAGGVRSRRRRRRARDRELQEKMDELRAAIDEELHEAVEEVGPALEDSFAEEEVANADDDRGSPGSGDEHGSSWPEGSDGRPRIRPRRGDA